MTRRLPRDYGLVVGELETGARNHICDVPGVSVGHVTLHNADAGIQPTDQPSDQPSDQPAAPPPGLPGGVCTGVTAILPHPGDWFLEKCVAASEVINGFGKTTGLVQLEELGQLESPIMLTNTFSVPAVTQGALQYMLAQNTKIGDSLGSLNVVVGECNDSYLNDMRQMYVTAQHSVAAIEAARGGPSFVQGAIGGGTGMRCFGWKGGIGSASRRLHLHDATYHIGVMVQSNFGRSDDLTILGAPVGRYFTPDAYGGLPPADEVAHETEDGRKLGLHMDGSVMIVLATDLPLDALQLKRLARRCVVGLAKTGSTIHNGSGDVVIAFSNANRIRHSEVSDVQTASVMYLSASLMSQAFRAVAQATEEAVLNSLFAAETTRGRRDRILPELPRDEVAEFVIDWTKEHHGRGPA